MATDSDSQLEPGQRLGEFEIIARIGRGGFATVYRARQRRIERDVAVKVLDARDTTDLTARRFMREVDLVKRLEHPNIVRLYDFGTAPDGRLWMATELVDGQELADVMAREGAMAPSRAIDIMLQALSALTEAHERDIVHRDIKPTNLMLVSKGAHRDVVKVLDFGIAKAFGHLDGGAVDEVTADNNALFGTPRYMPPERIQNDPGAPSSDVYSMGLLFIEMLSGQPAVSGDLALQVLGRQLTGRLEIPDWLDDTVLGPIVRRATARHVHDRYPSAREFFEALRKVPASTLERLDLTGSDEFVIEPDALESDLVAAVPDSAPTLSDSVEVLDSGEVGVERIDQARSQWRWVALAAAALAVGLVLMAVSSEGDAPGRVVAANTGEGTAEAGADARVAPGLPPAVGNGLARAISTAAGASLARVGPSERDASVADDVEWTLRSTPPGATVYDGRAIICSSTPCVVSPRAARGQVILVVKLEGHHDRRVTVDTHTDARLDVELLPLASTSVTPRVRLRRTDDSRRGEGSSLRGVRVR